jgi:hypothetical protein
VKKLFQHLSIHCKRQEENAAQNTCLTMEVRMGVWRMVLSNGKEVTAQYVGLTVRVSNRGVKHGAMSMQWKGTLWLRRKFRYKEVRADFIHFVSIKLWGAFNCFNHFPMIHEGLSVDVQ